MSSTKEYRDDDVSVGWCLHCGETLANLTLGGIGFCPTHGWVFAEWEKPEIPEDEMDDRMN